MERHIITLDEHGTLRVPDVPATAIWMDEGELLELFGVVAPTLRAAIRAVYKSGILNPGETEQRVRRPGRLRNGRAVWPPDGHFPCFPSSHLRGKAAA